MVEMKVVASRSQVQGDLRPLAQYWLAQILTRIQDGKFADPAEEAEFQEWKKAREAQKGA